MNCTPPLKSLFILPALNAGGAERVLITLMNGLDRSRIAPEMLAVNEEGGLRGLIAPDIPFHTLGRGTRVLRSLPRIYGALRRIRPDVVVSTMAHMNFALLMLHPFFPKTRFIVREAVTPSYLFAEKPHLRAPLHAAYAGLYPLADTVISPAQAIIDEFAALQGMSLKNHVLLYNPVDTDLIRAAESVPLPPADGTVRFVCAGRLHPQKGFDRLIAALPGLRLEAPWSLTILGEGAERAALEALVRERGLEDRVTLPGHSAAPWPLIAGAAAFLLPSRFEGLPNVALEALACGTPVIAMAEAGGIGEIAQAASGAVTVTETMEDFLRAMERTVPVTAQNFRSSLLPEIFSRPVIQAAFTGILTGAR